MMTKFVFVLLCLALNLFESSCAPVDYSPFQIVPMRVVPPPGIPGTVPQNPKFVWNFVGDIITNSGFLPIEINVPDTVASVAGGAQNLAQNIAMAAGSILQRIPFITRLTSPEKPRPFKLLVVDEHGQVVGMMNSGGFY